MADTEARVLNGAKRMILAASARNLPEAFHTTGFHPFDAQMALQALQEAGLWIGPRDALEQEPAFRQTIPYILLRVGDRFIRCQYIEDHS